MFFERIKNFKICRKNKESKGDENYNTKTSKITIYLDYYFLYQLIFQI